jgi:pimeloyl-ACP methyl ester carboxylesterase
MSGLDLILLAFAALCLIILLAYRLAERETMDAATFRAGSDFQTAALSQGTTAYRLYGEATAPTVIILHGATLGAMAYRQYVPFLVQAGYRVVLYDQYGRGFSDRPKATFSIAMLRRQLLDLMDHLEIEKAHLFGISLGGALAAHFAAEHGQRVDKLAYQVPAVSGAQVKFILLLGKLPVLGQLIGRFLAVPAIIQRGESYGGETPEIREVIEHFKGQFRVVGTERVMRQMLTGDLLGDRLADHARIASQGIQAQFVYATDDPEIAAADVEKALSLYDAPDVHRYTGGHFFAESYTQELVEKMDGFFKA